MCGGAQQSQFSTPGGFGSNSHGGSGSWGYASTFTAPTTGLLRRVCINVNGASDYSVRASLLQYNGPFAPQRKFASVALRCE